MRSAICLILLQRALLLLQKCLNLGYFQICILISPAKIHLWWNSRLFFNRINYNKSASLSKKCVFKINFVLIQIFVLILSYLIFMFNFFILYVWPWNLVFVVAFHLFDLQIQVLFWFFICLTFKSVFCYVLSSFWPSHWIFAYIFYFFGLHECISNFYFNFLFIWSSNLGFDLVHWRKKYWDT